MKFTPRYFVLFSQTTRNGVRGLRMETACLQEAEIIEIADKECARGSEALEDLAGIDWVEAADGTISPARDWKPGELFATACEKLADDGRAWDVYPDTQEGRADFVAAANALGLGDDRWVLQAG